MALPAVPEIGRKAIAGGFVRKHIRFVRELHAYICHNFAVPFFHTYVFCLKTYIITYFLGGGLQRACICQFQAIQAGVRVQ